MIFVVVAATLLWFCGGVRTYRALAAAVAARYGPSVFKAREHRARALWRSAWWFLPASVVFWRTYLWRRKINTQARPSEGFPV